MDVLMKTGAVKLRSHLDKYLVSYDYGEAIKQSRNASTKRAVWIVELCPNNPDAIRIKNLSSGLYLTASDSPFLLGMTGNRVLQLSIFDPARVEWEPISDGFLIKFRSHKGGGTYLRANGGSPPWRNSVTHDVPITSGTYNWVLWDVEPVMLSELKSITSGLSDGSTGSSLSSHYSARSIMSSPQLSFKKSGMDLFRNAKAIRLKSNHDKYLVADEDEETVTQNRNGASKNAKWTVEFVANGNGFRLKSCYNRYLTASNLPFLLGMTGHKVTQTLPPKLDSSLEWEPEKEGSQIRIRTRSGNYLRANGGLPPWRNSVTHDVPHRTVTKAWVLWYVDIVEIVEHSDEIYGLDQPGSGSVKDYSFGSESSSVSVGSEPSDRFERQESNDIGRYKQHSPPKADGRLIYYHIADDLGRIFDEGMEGNSFTFKGHNVTELTHKLEEETGLEDFFVCTRSPLNGKLYPLRLRLPPNKASMHIVVVPSTSRLARELENGGIS